MEQTRHLHGKGLVPDFTPFPAGTRRNNNAIVVSYNDIVIESTGSFQYHPKSVS